MKDRPGPRTPAVVRAFENGGSRARSDEVATEEPLEIRIDGPTSIWTVAVTMRTPGSDFELAAGFLYAEGYLRGRKDIAEIRYCLEPGLDQTQRYNTVTLHPSRTIDPDLVPQRRFAITSACGICGRATIDDLRTRGYATPKAPTVDAATLHALPDRLRASQGVFERTGGLHAAGLFDAHGNLVAVREDVGRHNALDKLIGWALLEDRLPLGDHLVLVSGRTSYEIVQKALAAGIGMVCAVSAPSSLAVAVADEFSMTLVGFLRDGRFNAYTGAERILPGA